MKNFGKIKLNQPFFFLTTRRSNSLGFLPPRQTGSSDSNPIETAPSDAFLFFPVNQGEV